MPTCMEVSKRYLLRGMHIGPHKRADLYANDESEFVVPTEQPEPSPVKTEPTVKEETKPIPAKQEPQPIPTLSSISSPPEDHKPLPSATNGSAASAIPSYSSPPTQHIPTYQERQPDYREPAPPRHDTYQGAPGVDRPVRPSEMKEEG